MEMEETFAYFCQQDLKISNGFVTTALLTAFHTAAQRFFISKDADSQKCQVYKGIVIGWSIKSWNQVGKFRA